MYSDRNSKTPTHPGEDADELRRLWSASTAATRADPAMPNPLWLDFPTKCIRTVPSENVMRKLIDHYNNSPDVMVVRYTQENCTPCNAIEKVFEYLCHDMQKKYPRLHFYDVSKEKVPEATKGMVRFPQVKAFHHGQWTDVDFKPPQEFRDNAFQQVEYQVHKQRKQGVPVSAVQAEEMYFSISAPAITQIMENSIADFYAKTQARCHNYWKQIAQRRAWFFNKYVAPAGSKPSSPVSNDGVSIFGEMDPVRQRQHEEEMAKFDDDSPAPSVNTQLS
eukprot:PhM_4_TR11256/c0_g1_i1/m.69962